MKFVTLNTEQKMPLVGLGTWKSEAGKVYQAIRWAIKLGYRHFDCAQIYDNQIEVGAALRDAINEDGIKREELFITSKIWNDAHLKDDVLPAINKILEELQLDYLDLLILCSKLFCIKFPFSSSPLILGCAIMRSELCCLLFISQFILSFSKI